MAFTDAAAVTPDRRAMVIAGAVALVLGAIAISVNLARSCAVNDTPYLGFCPKPADAAAALRQQIAGNPGDAASYVKLALAEAPANRSGALQAATRLAPTQPLVQMMRAADALDRQHTGDAIAPLVELVEHNGSEPAALTLARLVAAGNARLLEPYLTPGNLWVGRVLAQMPHAGGSVATALPLVALALPKKALDPTVVANYVAQLRGARAWGDAYSLWLELNNHTVPMLYNGSFEQAFIANGNGFDWEPNMPGPLGKLGAIIDRSGAEGRGAVLDIKFTGRAIALPMVRQYVFLGDGPYRLRGDFRSNRQFRIEQGLAWTVRCTESGQAVAGKSAPLTGTDDQWKAFTFEFTVPPGCGAVASLELESFAPVDAAVGARGRASFDNFTLERLPQ